MKVRVDAYRRSSVCLYSHLSLYLCHWNVLECESQVVGSICHRSLHCFTDTLNASEPCVADWRGTEESFSVPVSLFPLFLHCSFVIRSGILQLLFYFELLCKLTRYFGEPDKFSQLDTMERNVGEMTTVLSKIGSKYPCSLYFYNPPIKYICIYIYIRHDYRFLATFHVSVNVNSKDPLWNRKEVRTEVIAVQSLWWTGVEWRWTLVVGMVW